MTRQQLNKVKHNKMLKLSNSFLFSQKKINLFASRNYCKEMLFFSRVLDVSTKTTVCFRAMNLTVINGQVVEIGFQQTSGKFCLVTKQVCRLQIKTIHVVPKFQKLRNTISVIIFLYFGVSCNFS